MICSICAGEVQWQGPLSALTHTKCLQCGGINCQEVEFIDNENEEDNQPTEAEGSHE